MEILPSGLQNLITQTPVLVPAGNTAGTLNLIPNLLTLSKKAISFKGRIEQSSDGITWFLVAGWEDADIHNCFSDFDKNGMPILTPYFTAKFTEQIMRGDIVQQKGYDTKRPIPTDTDEVYYQLSLCPNMRITIETSEPIEYSLQIDFEDILPVSVLLGHHSASLLGVFTGAIVAAAAGTTSSRTTTAGTLITGSGAHFRATTAPTSVAITDNQSNSYTDVESSTGLFRMSLGYNIPSGGTRGAGHTVTSTASGGTGTSGSSVGAQEWNGIDSSPTVATNNQTDASNTAHSISVSPGSSSLVVGLFGYGGSTTTISVDSPGNQAQEIDESSTQQDQNVGYKVASSGATSIAWTVGAARTAAMVAMSFTETPSGINSSTNNYLMLMGLGI